MTKQFDVDFIVDTGDISDHGTAAENAYVQPIGTLGRAVRLRARQPRLAGHGGSGPRRSRTRSCSTTRCARCVGLRLAGIGDPRFTPDKDTRGQAAPTSVKVTGERLASLIRRQPAEAPVDIAMMHDPEGAAETDGTVPLVLAGHYHRRFQQLLPFGTLLFAQGSTGASGLRGLEGEKPTPAEASVLYFDRTTHDLQAWDDITLGGLGLTSVSIERHLRSSITATDKTNLPSPATWSPSPTTSSTLSPSDTLSPSLSDTSSPGG